MINKCEPSAIIQMRFGTALKHDLIDNSEIVRQSFYSWPDKNDESPAKEDIYQSMRGDQQDEAPREQSNSSEYLKQGLLLALADAQSDVGPVSACIGSDFGIIRLADDRGRAKPRVTAPSTQSARRTGKQGPHCTFSVCQNAARAVRSCARAPLSSGSICESSWAMTRGSRNSWRVESSFQHHGPERSLPTRKRKQCH